MTEADLRKITAPTQIIWGTNDPLGGVNVAEAIAAELPDSRLKILEAGHGPWLGHPSEVARLISEFAA